MKRKGDGDGLKINLAIEPITKKPRIIHNQNNNPQTSLITSTKKVKTNEQDKIFDDSVSALFLPEYNQTDMRIKDNPQLRPCYVTKDGQIYLETFSPIYAQAYEFLVAIAEPVSRPMRVHHYKLTDYSLYAAVSIGLETEQIIQVLENLSKVYLSEETKKMIRDQTSSYGKAKLVLKENKYYIESPLKAVLNRLRSDPLIFSCINPNPTLIDSSKNSAKNKKKAQNQKHSSSVDDDGFGMDDEDENPKSIKTIEDGLIVDTVSMYTKNDILEEQKKKQAEESKKLQKIDDLDEELDDFEKKENENEIMDLDPEENSKNDIDLDPPFMKQAHGEDQEKHGNDIKQEKNDASQYARGISDIMKGNRNLGYNISASENENTFMKAESSESSNKMLEISSIQSRTSLDVGDDEDISNALNDEDFGDDMEKMNIDEEEDANMDEENGGMSSKKSKSNANSSKEEGVMKLYSLEVKENKFEDVKKSCLRLKYPALEEYDFRNDKVNSNLDIDLQAKTIIRNYQEKSLSKMFSNGRARSGIIVLPCGAGKTLVGITAACTIKKSVLVLTIHGLSVDQWYAQFTQWAKIDESKIIRFKSENKELSKIEDKKDEAFIVISTYNMITQKGRRAEESQRMMEFIRRREWGLMILDEVHVTPAQSFKSVVEIVKAHAKLGLTATLLREDNKTDDLYYLIGPKLYEANWLDLQQAGFIAKVECVEVWCPMTAEFYREYLSCTSRKKLLLYTMNPTKYRVCEWLVRQHELRGDKIIVFSDNIFALDQYAKRMKRPLIYGKTNDDERKEFIQSFRNNPTMNTLFLSKVGDVAIDIPEASVIIQISSHFGSRRQEAQRLGRILRPKQSLGNSVINNLGAAGKHGNLKEKSKINSTGYSTSAYFYSLVSQDTEEMSYSSRRQKFLVDQGYSFKVLNDLYEVNIKPELEAKFGAAKLKKEELDTLDMIKKQDETTGEVEKVVIPGASTSYVEDEMAANSEGKKKKKGKGVDDTKSNVFRISLASKLSKK